MTSTFTPPRPGGSTPAPSHRDLDGIPRLMRPMVDFVARIRARLETKLLAGFLGIPVLMLALGIVGPLVVNRMDAQVDRLSTLQRQ